jgi:hypothetical protein
MDSGDLDLDSSLFMYRLAVRPPWANRSRGARGLSGSGWRRTGFSLFSALFLGRAT